MMPSPHTNPERNASPPPRATTWHDCTPEQTRESARRIARAIFACAAQGGGSLPLRVYLSGQLGAGKTFWVRAALRAWGHKAEVPSPSYMVALSYQVANLTIHHLDCYRLQGANIDAESLELLQDNTAICLLEWQENARGLPPADMHIELLHQKGSGGKFRTLRFTALSDNGQRLLAALSESA